MSFCIIQNKKIRDYASSFALCYAMNHANQYYEARSSKNFKRLSDNWQLFFGLFQLIIICNHARENLVKVGKIKNRFNIALD